MLFLLILGIKIGMTTRKDSFLKYSDLERYIGYFCEIKMWIESEIRTKNRSAVRGEIVRKSEGYAIQRGNGDVYELFSGDTVYLWEGRERNRYDLK